MHLRRFGHPEWVRQMSFVGVLRFGEWSVMRGAAGSPPVVGSGNLLIMDDRVAPDN